MFWRRWDTAGLTVFGAECSVAVCRASSKANCGMRSKRERIRTGSTTLIITADADAPHGFVIDAMEMATMAGVEQIDVEIQEPPKQQTP